MFVYSIGLFINQPTTVEAQLFGSDNKMGDRILLEVKKLNTRISERAIPQIQNANRAIEKVKTDVNRVRAEVNKVRSGNKTVNQQMEILSSVVPAMQGSMEQSQVQIMQEIQSLGKRLAQLEARIKENGNNQEKLLNAINEKLAVF